MNPNYYPQQQYYQQPGVIDPHLANVLVTLTDVQAKTAAFVFDKENGAGNEKSGLKKFPPQKQNLVLFASATPDKLVPTEPTPDYKTLLETKKDQAQAMVQFGVNIQRGGSQLIDYPMATALHVGNFYNPEGNGNPKGISIFFATPASYNHATSTAMGDEEVDLRSKSNNLTDSQISALTKSQARVPRDGYGVRSTIENQLCMIDYLFGKQSHMYIQLAKLLAATNGQQHKLAFDAMIAKTPENPACFLQAVDIKLQLFLGSCVSATSVNDVNYGILNFDEEIRKIMLQQSFSTQLPAQIQHIVTKLKNPNNGGKGNKNKGGTGGGGGTKTKATDEEVEAKGSRKRKGDGGDGEGKDGKTNPEPVKNTSPIDKSWIKKNESYMIYHNHSKSAPTLDGKAICLKYHVKGMCAQGDACPRKASHTDKFDAETKTKFDEWVKTCREKDVEGNN